MALWGFSLLEVVPEAGVEPARGVTARDFESRIQGLLSWGGMVSTALYLRFNWSPSVFIGAHLVSNGGRMATVLGCDKKRAAIPLPRRHRL